MRSPEYYTLFLRLDYLHNHPGATANQVDTYIRQKLARIKDPVEAAIQEGAESEERAGMLFRNFEEIYDVKSGDSEDDHVDIDMWVFYYVLTFTGSEYRVDDRRIPSQVKSSGTGVDEVLEHMEIHGDYRSVIDVGFERDDEEILLEIQDRFEIELGISLTRVA